MLRSLLGLALIATQAQAQFAPLGAQWTYGQPETDGYTLTVTTDTLIDGITCSIVEGEMNSPCWEAHAFTYQTGDEVYFRNAGMDEFALLYDWGAAAGSSWDIVFGANSLNVTLTYSVLSTGTTTINGQTRRTMQVELHDSADDSFAYTSGQLIEGIGDLHYLFPWLMPWCDAMNPGPIRCYSDGDLGTYLAPGISACSIIIASAATVFAPVNAKWTYTQKSVFVPPFDSTLYVLECTGDTTIEGMTCSIIERTAGWYTCMGEQRYITTMGDSVLFWNDRIEDFTPLYVFGAIEGESWSTIVPDPYQEEFNDTIVTTVTATGEVEVEGMLLRTMEISAVVQNEMQAWVPFGTTALIERLGGQGSMFPWIFQACDGDVIGPLRCYEDDEISWLNTSYPDCAFSTGIQSVAQQSSMHITPNIITSGEPINIRFDRDLGPLARLDVSDASGRLIASHPIVAGTTQVIAPSSSGMFFLSVRSASGTVRTQRIVVN